MPSKVRYVPFINLPKDRQTIAILCWYFDYLNGNLFHVQKRMYHVVQSAPFSYRLTAKTGESYDVVVPSTGDKINVKKVGFALSKDFSLSEAFAKYKELHNV